MKRPAQTSPTNAQKTADVTRSSHRQGATVPGGRLAQLSDILNASPRAQAFTEVKDGIQHSPQVQHLANLTAEANRGMPAQFHGIEANDRPLPENEAEALGSRALAGERQAAVDDAGDESLAALNNSVQRKLDAAGTEPQSDPAALAEDSQSSIRSSNRTGLPDQLKSGVESLSGISLDHVRVHYNSAQPKQLHADAFAQGSQIHVGPGQEKHLPHEAWHVVQQAQGRVHPTMQMKNGVAVNDNRGLEHEADVMGAKALASAPPALPGGLSDPQLPDGHAMVTQSHGAVVQRHLATDLNSGKFNVAIAGEHHHEIPEEHERSLWGEHGIAIHYEADSIPLGGASASGVASTVTPDPLILRIGFAWTALTDYVKDFLQQAKKPEKIPPKQFEGAQEVLDYLLPTLKTDLNLAHKDAKKSSGENPVFKEVWDLLTELTPLLSKSGKLEELEMKIIATRLRIDFPKIEEKLGGLHAASEFRGVAFAQGPLRVARSQQMLARVDNVSGALRNTIYKVGDRHVTDIRTEGLKPKGKVGIYNRSEYTAEMMKLLPELASAAAAAGPASGLSAPPPSSSRPSAASSPKPQPKPPASVGKVGPGKPALGLPPPVSSVAAVDSGPKPAAKLPAASGRVGPGKPASGPPPPVSSVPAVDSGPKPPSRRVEPSPNPASQIASARVDPSPKSPAKPPASVIAEAEPKKPSAQPPKAAAASSSKSSRSKAPAKSAPVRSAEDLQLDQVQHLIDGAGEKSRKAKGFIAIQDALGTRDRRSAAGVISAIREILKERDDRWAITKWAVREKETQELYDAIAAVLGPEPEVI